MHNIKCGEKCENFQMKIILLLLGNIQFFFSVHIFMQFLIVLKNIDFMFFFSNFAKQCTQHVFNAKRKKCNHFLLKLVAIKRT